MGILRNCPNLWPQSKRSQSRVHPYIHLYPTPGITGPQSVQIHTRVSCWADATSVPASQETFQGDVSDAGWVTDSAARGTSKGSDAPPRGPFLSRRQNRRRGSQSKHHLSPCSCPKSHPKAWSQASAQGPLSFLPLWFAHLLR